MQNARNLKSGLVGGNQRRTALALALVLVAAATAGCLSAGAERQRRSAAHPDILQALPAEQQARVLRGEVAVGDTTQMVWVAYGEPTRISQRVTPAGTSLVWSYSYAMRTDGAYPSWDWRPVQSNNGRVVWVRVPRYYLDDQAWSEYEYLRVEFVDGRVVAVETARDR